MPPGAPAISFFPRCLHNSKAMCIARVDNLRTLQPSDGIMLVLLSIWLYDVIMCRVRFGLP